jgi:hypothetical protein
MNELILPAEVSGILSKSRSVNAAARRVDSKRKFWRFWRSTDKNYDQAIDLYQWRNELNKEFGEEVEKYVRETPGTYDLGYIKLGAIRSKDDESKVTVTFRYGFPIVANGKRIDVDFETEGVMAVEDPEVNKAQIEVIGKDLPPLLHLPSNWTFLIDHPHRWLEMRAHGYAKWQPELTKEPRRIKIPDNLEIEFVRDNSDEARVYTETEVLK